MIVLIVIRRRQLALVTDSHNNHNARNSNNTSNSNSNHTTCMNGHNMINNNTLYIYMYVCTSSINDQLMLTLPVIRRGPRHTINLSLHRD